MDKSKSRLFLIEMVVIILFFSIAAAVCTNMFAQAKAVSAQSTELTMALMEAQEAAETFKSAGGDPMAVGEKLGAQEDGESLVAYFNEAWERTDGQSAYSMKMDFSAENGLRRAEISMYKGNEEIYRIQTAIYGDRA